MLPVIVFLIAVPCPCIIVQELFCLDLFCVLTLLFLLLFSFLVASAFFNDLGLFLLRRCCLCLLLHHFHVKYQVPFDLMKPLFAVN